MNSLKKSKQLMSMFTLLEVKEKKVKNIITYTTKTMCFISLELTKKNIQAKPRYACKIKRRYKHKIQ